MPVYFPSGYSDQDKTHVLFYNHMNAGNTTALGSVSGFPIQNVLDPATYNSWRAPGAPTAQIDTAFLQPRVIGAVGIAAHNMGSVGARVDVQVSNDGTSYTTVMTLPPPVTNEDILFVFPHVTVSYLRLNFSLAAPTIGVVMASAPLRFPCTPIDSYTPAHHSKRYTKYFNNSLQGQFLGNRVMGSGGTMSVQFPHVQRNWVDGPLIGFEDHYNRGGTFFYAGWPGGKPQDMAYAWPGSEDSIIDVEYVNADKLATVSFDMEFYNPT